MTPSPATLGSSGRAWYYASSGGRAGPVPEATLVEMVRRGQVGAATRVWTEGMADWAPAGDVPALRAMVRPEGAEDIGQNAGIRMLIPVGRSGWAIAAGYLGLFGMFPALGLVCGPAAVVTGVLAVRAIRRDTRAHGMGRAITGIVLGGIGTLYNYLGLIVILAGR